MELVSEIKLLNLQICELKKQRDKIVSDHSVEILNKVFKMMDWDKSNLSRASPINENTLTWYRSFKLKFSLL